MSAEQREIRELNLKKQYANKLNCTIDSLPMQIDRTIEMQAALGEDYDPQKISQVLAAWEKSDIELEEFFIRNGEDTENYSDKVRDEWASIRNSCWTTINEVLGSQDFITLFDEPLSFAIEMFNAIAHHKFR